MMPRPKALAGAVLASTLWAQAGAAMLPLPLASGTYCGPGEAKIVVDAASNTVAMEGVVCSAPVIAADHMQSNLCSTPQGVNETRNFDFRVVGKAFFHDGEWYRLCGAAPNAGG